MTRLTRDEAHLLLAAIRVMGHLLERSPTPGEIADLLRMSPSAVGLQLSVLQDLGAVAMVQTAFETHAEVRDPALVEQLPQQAGPAISEDLRAFDKRKQEEADRMSHLFDSGEHDRQRRQKLQAMDKELQDFHRKKPGNTFGES